MIFSEGHVAMGLLRLYSDDLGESHFEVVDYPMMLLDDSPPAKPHYFTEARPATAWASVRCPPDWDGGLHPAPRRQIIVCTAGAIRVTTSLGDAREIGPGGAVLLEDTQGKGPHQRGHLERAVRGNYHPIGIDILAIGPAN